MKLVVLGLSLSSSWGNGHATTFRALLRAFAARGHSITFLEREQPWYAEHRDLHAPDFCTLKFYHSLEELRKIHAAEIAEADSVIVGSYVPDGIAVGEWVCAVSTGVTAFYDIDTPVTLAQLERDDCPYLSLSLVAKFDRYFSFTGGPTLRRLENTFGAQCALPLYCSVDESAYFPEPRSRNVDLGYLGTYSADRQPALDQLLNTPAARLPERRFGVAGSLYPAEIRWPKNVQCIEHLPPAQHRAFYNQQRFTLNLTRAEMIRLGYSPSVRLFEAAACGVPIISDWWEGLDTFFEPEKEIHIACNSEDVCALLSGPDSTVGEAARKRVLQSHTSSTRAAELESFLDGSFVHSSNASIL